MIFQFRPRPGSREVPVSPASRKLLSVYKPAQTAVLDTLSLFSLSNEQTMSNDFTTFAPGLYEHWDSAGIEIMADDLRGYDRGGLHAPVRWDSHMADVVRGRLKR